MRSVCSKVLNTLISKICRKYQCSLNCINLPIHLSRIINIWTTGDSATASTNGEFQEMIIE